MVMYCNTEGLVGGATNFGKANVYVRPQVNYPIPATVKISIANNSMEHDISG
jgi:hypothetical protein